MELRLVEPTKFTKIRVADGFYVFPGPWNEKYARQKITEAVNRAKNLGFTVDEYDTWMHEVLFVGFDSENPEWVTELVNNYRDDLYPHKAEAPAGEEAPSLAAIQAVQMACQSMGGVYMCDALDALKNTSSKTATTMKGIRDALES